MNGATINIKSKFILEIPEDMELTTIRQLFKVNNFKTVTVTLDHLPRSALNIVNFRIRSVQLMPWNIHEAKIEIDTAVDLAKNILPKNVEMYIHLCNVGGCKELVAVDAEGYCNRHRGRKWHKMEASQSEQSIQRIKSRINSSVAYTSYLKNVVSNGIHIWRFKLKNPEDCDKIEIRNMLDEHCGTDYFAFLSDSRLITKKAGMLYWTRCWPWLGNIVEMRVDFNLFTLSFKVNDNDYGVAIDIVPGKYRACISMCSDKSRYILESYQKIY